MPVPLIVAAEFLTLETTDPPMTARERPRACAAFTAWEGTSWFVCARLPDGAAWLFGLDKPSAKPAPGVKAPRPTTAKNNHAVFMLILIMAIFRLGFILATAQEYHHQRRHDDEQHDGSDQHAADDDRGQWTLHLASDASGNRRR